MRIFSSQTLKDYDSFVSRMSKKTPNLTAKSTSSKLYSRFKVANRIITPLATIAAGALGLYFYNSHVEQ